MIFSGPILRQSVFYIHLVHPAATITFVVMNLTATSLTLCGNVLLAEAFCTHSMPNVPTSDLASGTCMQLGMVHRSVCWCLTLLIMLVVLTSCLVPVAVPLVLTCI